MYRCPKFPIMIIILLVIIKLLIGFLGSNVLKQTLHQLNLSRKMFATAKYLNILDLNTAGL